MRDKWGTFARAVEEAFPEPAESRVSDAGTGARPFEACVCALV